MPKLGTVTHQLQVAKAVIILLNLAN